MGAEMTSRERLLAAIRHEEPDRVPVVPRYHAYCFERYGNNLVEEQLRINGDFGWDNYIALPSLTASIWPNYAWNLSLEDFSPLEREGVRVDIKKKEEREYWLLERTFHTPAGRLSDRVKWPKPDCGYGIRPNGHFLEHLVKDRQDLPKLRHLLLDPYKYSDFDTLERTKMLVGEDGLIMAYVNSPLDNKAGCVYGAENLMVACYDDPDFVASLLEIFREHTVRETKVLLERGVDGIHGTWYWSSLSAGWSPSLIEELFLPLAKEQIDLVHSFNGIYYYYDDGKLMPSAGRLKELGADILGTCVPPPVGDCDMGELKRRIGDSVCLHGNSDVIYTLKTGSEESIREDVRRLIKSAAPGGGFILGTSDSIREGTPEENIRTWSRAAREYGKYPIGL